MQFLNQVIRTSPSWLISVDEICRVGMLFICMRLHAIQLSPFWFSAFAFEKIPIASFLGGWACLGQRLSLNDVHRHLDTNGTQVEVNHKTDPRFALNCNDLYQGLWVCFHFRLRHYMKSPCFFCWNSLLLSWYDGIPSRLLNWVCCYRCILSDWRPKGWWGDIKFQKSRTYSNHIWAIFKVT